MPAAEPDDGALRRQIWLTLFRLVLVTVLLGGTAFWQWSAGLARGESAVVGPLYTVVLVTYAASLALAVAFRLGWPPLLTGLAQVVLDVGLAAGVVALTGYADSVFVFLFVIAIVNASLVLFRRGAILAAVLSVLVYVPLALFLAPSPPPPPTMFVHGGALLATAALAAYLSEQLRRTGERLAAREVDLAEITALHEAIVQSVQSGLVTLDREGRVTFLNRAGEHLTGYRREEVLGRAPAWLPPLTGGGERAEMDLENGRGERLRLGYAAFPLRTEAGAELGRAVIFQDLTQMRAMEERVQRSERLADLGRVAAGLAHELRNPLASMSGSLELLRDGAVRPEERRLMEIVLREATRLDQLVARFLEYSRPAPPRRAAVDLLRVAQETLEVFSHDPASARTRVVTELAAVRASCDPDQIRQVLWNLLVNACQASPTAAVTVRCGPVPGGGAFLEVEDDGPGIAADDLSQIFTPFFTTKPSGTGLGLATVQRLVDAHGGSVSVRSEPGRGACFTVRLPAGA